MARGGTLTMTGCTVSGNKAGVDAHGRSFNGGGVSLAYVASATLTNCTISGNNAAGNGGGVWSTYGTARPR